MQMAQRLTRYESSAANRARLVKAAEQAFVRRGFHGASLQLVGDIAGLTTGAVYSRFASKGELFVAVLESRRGEIVRHFGERAAAARTLAQLLHCLAEAWSEQLADGAPWQLALVEFWSYAGRDPELLALFRAEHRALLEALGAVLDDAATGLGVSLPRPGAEIVRLATALGHGSALELLVEPGCLPEQTMQRAFDAVTSITPADAVDQRGDE